MKILSITATGLFALALAACSPASEEGPSSSGSGDTSADATTMPPADSTMMPPADGTVSGNAGPSANGAMTGTAGTNPDGTPMAPAQDGQTSGMTGGTPGTTPPVQ